MSEQLEQKLEKLEELFVGTEAKASKNAEMILKLLQYNEAVETLLTQFKNSQSTFRTEMEKNSTALKAIAEVMEAQCNQSTKTVENTVKTKIGATWETMEKKVSSVQKSVENSMMDLDIEIKKTIQMHRNMTKRVFGNELVMWTFIFLGGFALIFLIVTLVRSVGPIRDLEVVVQWIYSLSEPKN